MNGVLKHNVHDIVSLAALTVCAADRVVSEPARLDNPLDLFSLGRIVENTGEWKRALTFYERALAGGLPDPIQSKALENLAVLSRRAGDHSRSLALCQQLMAEYVMRVSVPPAIITSAYPCCMCRAASPMATEDAAHVARCE